MKILNFDEFINEAVVASERPAKKKAVKIFNIKWDLSNVDPKESIELEKKLPKSKGFMADGDFEVAEKVPVLLKKKYGYDIKDFSFNEYRIVEDIEGLLYLCLKSGEAKGKLFNVSGRLTALGEELFDRLVKDVKRRKEMEKEGADEYKMPKHLDEIMLGIENLYELEWDSCNIDALLKPVKRAIEVKRHIKPVKPTRVMDDFDDDEEAVREIDDDEVPQDVKDEDTRRRAEAEEEEGDEELVSEDTKLFHDEKTDRWYFGDTTWYMTEDEGEFRVYDDGEYQGKYCGSLDALKKEDDPLNKVLQGL